MNFLVNINVSAMLLSVFVGGALIGALFSKPNKAARMRSVSPPSAPEPPQKGPAPQMAVVAPPPAPSTPAKIAPTPQAAAPTPAPVVAAKPIPLTPVVLPSRVPKLIMCDLDGTLAESKQPIHLGMSEVLSKLLNKTVVAIASGGSLSRFLIQVVERLPKNTNLNNLYLLPTSGAAMYEFKNGAWREVYMQKLNDEEIARIIGAIRAAYTETNLFDLHALTWGERIENRESEVSISALGQQAPIEEKRRWDPDKSKRRLLQSCIAPRLPDFQVSIGGLTTIDITKKGIDKAYGLEQLSQRLSIPVDQMLYVGDELEENGNDFVVTRTGVKTYGVKAPLETEQLLRDFADA